MLYKYLSSERLDILENGLIRFTQPGDFNDPFELNPRFQLMSKHEIAQLPEVQGKEGNSQKSYYLTPEAISKMLSAIQPGIERTIAQTVSGGGTFHLNNNLIARNTYDSEIGILSLTETPDNILMWAHYAENHKGIVLQFDEHHEFFQPTLHREELLPLRKVEYRDERPALSYSTIYSPVIYYRKSLDWSYEKEWRLIKLINSANKVIDHPQYPRALFNMPLDAIKGIIIGFNVSHEKRKSIFEFLQKEELRHIIIYQTRLNENSYKLEIDPPINGSSLADTSGTVCEAY